MAAVDFDDVIDKFSIYGRYHVLFMFFTFLAFASNSVYCSNFVFAAENIEYKCKDEAFGDNVCSTKDISNNTIYCKEWIYENPHSFVAEFNLACQEWKRTLVGTVHSFGYMVGLLVVGPLSDRLGRKVTLVITGMLGGVFGLLRSITPWYWVYILFEFLEAAIGDNCSPMFILTIEIVSTKKRVLFYMLCSFGYSFGGIMLPSAAWLVPYWRTFLQVIYTPSLLFFIYLFFIDESPRWLLTKGKKDEAIKVLEKIARTNNMHLDKSALEKLECEEQKDIRLMNLLKITFSSKILAKRCLICIVWWITSTFVNFGMSINSVSLQGNKYVNYMLMSVVDLPGNIVTIYILNYFKRKLPLITSFGLGAALCLSQPFVPTYLPWLSILLYMAGKVMASFFFNITYMYTSELFPTYTRNSMHALCSSMGRLGSIVAPQTPLLMQFWTGLPSVVFGSVSLLAGLLTFLMPDTADNSLPNTVKQAEALGKDIKKDLSKVKEDLSVPSNISVSQGVVNFAFKDKQETGLNSLVSREGIVSRL